VTRIPVPAILLTVLPLLAHAAPAPAPRPAVPAVPVRPLSVQDATADKNGVKRMVVLRGLDKITGRAIDIPAPAGVPVRFGSLTITARYCYTVPPEEPPETAAFLQIDDNAPGEPPKRMFSGWMFASTPALNGLEHPVYDVWVITCKTDQPDVPLAPDAGVAAPRGPPPPTEPPEEVPPPAAPDLPRP
jgi:hypothetical protein